MSVPATLPATPSRTGVWARLRSHPAFVCRVAHYASLALGLTALVVLARGQWFFFDEWDIMWQPEGLRRLVEGHNGHWSLVPIAFWQLLQHVFGLGSYLPFMLMAIVAHLTVVHLVWRIMLRLRVDKWIATAACVVLVFFGAGSENLLWAFQVGFVGAIALMLGAILLLLRPTMSRRSLLAVTTLMLLGLASAGTALPFLVAAALIAWRRHGWRIALVVSVPPALLYLVWFLVIAGPNPLAMYRAHGAASSLIGIPQYVATMLVGSWTAVTPVPDFGLVVVTALAVGAILVLRRRGLSPRTATVLALAAAGVIFAILTGYSRLELGLASATDSRYVYLVIVAMVPGACVLLSALARGVKARSVIVALLGVVFFYNLGLLGGDASASSARDLGTRAVVSASIALADEYPDQVDLNGRPDPVYVPRNLRELVELRDDFGLETTTFDDAARLTALAQVGVDVDPIGGRVCNRPVEAGQAFPTNVGVVLSDPDGGELVFALRQDDVTGGSRTLTLEPGTTELVSIEAADLVVVSPPAGLLLCGS